MVTFLNGNDGPEATLVRSKNKNNIIIVIQIHYRDIVTALLNGLFARQRFINMDLGILSSS